MVPEKPLAPTILVVDDERLIRWSLKESLAREGFHVLEAQTGLQALQQLGTEGEDVALVFLDLKLPDSDDLSLLARIKSAHPACQVVLMTAYGTSETRDEAVRRGAYCVLDKPFCVDRMGTLAREVLESPLH